MKEEDDDKMKALLWSYEIVAPEKALISKDENFEDLTKKLSIYLNQLLDKDFNKLISILYRIDVSQEKASKALAANKNIESAGDTLARLIIHRQMEKIETRRKYRNK